MDRTWMPTTGGILSIICGALNIIGGIVFIIIGIVTEIARNFAPKMPPVVLLVIFVVVGIITLILGIISLIGGIYALRRKLWGMALAGSITSVFNCFWYLGVASIVFIALSHKEFS
jgi:hypothetical protein